VESVLKVGEKVRWCVGFDLKVEGVVVGILKAGSDVRAKLRGVPPEFVRIREYASSDDRYLAKTADGFYYACRCSLVDKQMQILR
jgi:hypothetical protein